MFIQISILGKGKITNTVKTTAEYRAPNLISVVLPVSARNRKRSISSEYGIGFNISLSYDNTNFGEDLTFIIYDDSCYSCNSTTSTCTLLVISKVKMNFISWYRWLKENCNDSCFVSLSEFMFKKCNWFHCVFCGIAIASSNFVDFDSNYRFRIWWRPFINKFIIRPRFTPLPSSITLTKFAESKFYSQMRYL